MRAASLIPVIFAITLGAMPASAGSRVINLDTPNEAQQAPRPTTEADFEKYRGYMFDLSEYDGRKDFAQISDNLKHQLDMVENAGFSPRVLEFFHTIPIVASENDCLELGAGIACYGPVAPSHRRHASLGLTVWDHDRQQWTNPDIVELAADSGRGVIKLRPNMMQYTDDPILLHEFLHAFHGRMMSLGFDNLGVKGYFAEAKAKDVFGNKKAYALMNPAEFFAVTASIFLAGKESIHEPKTRAVLKEKMPDYYKYLVGVFGFDPDPSLPSPDKDKAGTPVASAN
jgi:hypothetical protein